MYYFLCIVHKSLGESHLYTKIPTKCVFSLLLLQALVLRTAGDGGVICAVTCTETWCMQCDVGANNQ